MGKQQLVVAAKEADYISRLADYIRNSTFGESWQLTAFTNAAALRQFVKGGYAVDLLAAQPQMLRELEDIRPELAAAALVMRAGEHTGLPEVRQYQPLPQLLQSLSAVYAASGASPGKADNSSGAAVIAVYSASGGVGKTTLALQLAQLAGIRGARVFYLNLEHRNAASLWLGEGSGDDFSMMLYTLQTQPEKAGAKLLELRRRHHELKLDYFAPCANGDERLELTGELVRRLLDLIARSGQYELIAVDLDDRLDAMNYEVLQAAGNALWLVGADSVSEAKTSLALRYGEQKWGQPFRELARSFSFVRMGGAGASPAEFGSRLKARCAAVLPYVGEWRDGPGRAGSGEAAAYRGAVEALLAKLKLLPAKEGG